MQRGLSRRQQNLLEVICRLFVRSVIGKAARSRLAALKWSRLAGLTDEPATSVASRKSKVSQPRPTRFIAAVLAASRSGPSVMAATGAHYCLVSAWMVGP